MPNNCLPRPAEPGLPRLGSCNNLTSGVPQTDVKTTVQALELGDFSETLSPDENAARVVFRPYDEGAAIALFVPLGQSPCMSPTRPLATIPRKGGMPRTGSFDDLALGERQHDLKSVHLGGVKGSFSSTDSSCSSFWLLDSKPDASDASAGDAKLQRRVLVFAESGRGEGDCDMAAQGRPQPDGPCHSWGQAGQR